jgi:fumarylpyruvate hydrolase
LAWVLAENVKDELVFAIDAPATPSLAIHDSAQRFPLRRVFCVGRNYAAHAREMGSDPTREPPFFFMKPADAVVDAGGIVPYPLQTENLQFEAELVVAIGKAGRQIRVEDALDHVWGYAIGNDLTRRDLQIAAREIGRPWEFGKAFDQSAVIGPLFPIADTGPLTSGAIRLALNGQIKQHGDLSDMIWPTPEIISYLSHSIAIAPGDLIMTGTPEGVDSMVTGDVFVISIAGLGEIRAEIGPRV